MNDAERECVERYRDRIMRVPQRGRSLEETLFLRRGILHTLSSDEEEIAAYVFGSGPAVLFVHGAYGSIIQLAPMVEAVVASGCSAICFDLPGHGESKNEGVGVLKTVTALSSLGKNFGAFKSIISHSFGAIPACYAVAHDALEVDSLVSIAAPALQRYVWDLLFKMHKVPEWCRDAILGMYKEKYGENFLEENSPCNLINKIIKPVLLVHDVSDRVVPFSHFEQLRESLPRAGTTFVTSELGHFRLLADPKTVATVVEFVHQKASVAAS